MRLHLVYTHLLALSACNAAVVAAQCYKYVIISTRGFNEPQGHSQAFPGMIKTTLSTVSGGVEYDTVYPAGNDTQSQGAAAIVSYINAGLKSCPQQKYALLGYSEGATATNLALRSYNDSSSAAYKNIVSVIDAGNPNHLPLKTSNVDENGGKTTNALIGALTADGEVMPDFWYNSGKFLDICYLDDPVCGITPFGVLSGGKNHLKYNQSSVQTLGSNWMIPKLQ